VPQELVLAPESPSLQAEKGLDIKTR